MTADPLTITEGDRRSPLSGWDARLASGSREGVVSLAELGFLTQIGLRIPEAAVPTRRACAEAVGLELPDRAGLASGGADRSVLWLGPDEWLIVDRPGREHELLPALAAATGTAHASVVDLSANRTVLELSGPRAREVLEGSCRLDLHPRAFSAGRCAATDIALVGVYLHQREETTYRLFVRASFAAHLVRWLLDAMVEHVAASDELLTPPACAPHTVAW